MVKTGIFLVNLGTPLSAQDRDVRKYLIEFLTDPRVIDYGWIKRQLLVRGIIVPFRYKESARMYRSVWREEGSPLLVYGKSLKEKLSARLEERFPGAFQVELGMRYQQPSIKEELEKLKACDRIIVVPLFPQYASATTGSLFQQVFSTLSGWQTIPALTCIQSYEVDTGFIEAAAMQMQSFSPREYDAVVFSFHGLPIRQLKKANPSCGEKGCCTNEEKNTCYAKQCYATAKALANRLGIGSYEVAFQSRLGKDPWIGPPTTSVLTALAKAGKKRVLIASPSFVADCLETIYEIGIEYDAHFKEAGGEILTLAPCVNDSEEWVSALETLTLRELGIEAAVLTDNLS